MTNNHEARIQQALAAAKTGKRDEARQILLKVVREDETNARAWMLLARVATEADEKRTALNNVIELDPDNQQANQMLAQLTISGVFSEESQSAARAGASFRRIVIGAMLMMLLVIIGIIALLATRSNEQAAGNDTQTLIVANLTQVASVQTETAAATAFTGGETATAFALLPTPTATDRPTLLPPDTATPSITPLASATPIPAPQGLPGVIIGWGGSNALNDGFFPVVQFSLDGTGTIIDLSGTNRGELVAAFSRSQVIYTRYFRDLFERYLSMIDVSTGQQENMAFRFDPSAEVFARATTPQITPDGRLLVFVAETGFSEIRQVYVFDFNALVGTDPIRRLTNDDFDYDFPAISPDGTQVIAVRRGRAPQPPQTDLVLISLSSPSIVDWTMDGDTTVETHPRWSPDGKLVAYVAGTQTDPKGDLFVRTTGESPSSFNVTRTAGIDEIFPVFSPDSRYLAYSSDADSDEFRTSYNVYIYDLINGSSYQVTRDDERYYPGAWIE